MGLTGVERKLVLDYLISEDVPITIKSSSLLFPLAVKKNQYEILEQGILILKDSDENPQKFENLQNQNLKVQFYFNKLALYFEAMAKKTSAGLSIVISKEINKVVDRKPFEISGFYATVYFGNSADKNPSSKNGIDCPLCKKIPVFKRPEWNEVSEKNLVNAKNYVAKFLLSKNDKEAELSRMIRICRYLFDDFSELPESESIENRFHSPEIIFADSTSLVFASKKADMQFLSGSEYEILLHFPVEGPLKERKVLLTGKTESVFESYDCTKLCAILTFSSVKEEDERFLKDKFSDL